MKQSFINNEVTLTKIIDKSDLEALMRLKRSKEDFVLENLDLSEMANCTMLDFSGFTLKNIIFSRFKPICPKKRFLFNLSFMGAKLEGVSFAQSYLLQCNFDTMDKEAIRLHKEKMGEEKTSITGNEETVVTDLNKVDFFFSQLSYCRFRRTVLNTVDFRYSHITDCTMSEIEVHLGDFYFTAFEGCTNFIGARFYTSSFTCATFEHNSIRMSNIPKGIVQEYPKIYHENLIQDPNWIRYNPCASFSSMNPKGKTKDYDTESKANIAIEAAQFYKELSGTLSGKGLHGDSNEAYKKSKTNELDFCKLALQLPEKQRKLLDGKELKSNIIYKHRIYSIRLIQLFGYGYKWKAPLLWFSGIVLVYTIICKLCPSSYNIMQLFSWSLNNSMSPNSNFTSIIEKSINYLGTFIASLESVAGILLIGFLGFIIANKVRNNS